MVCAYCDDDPCHRDKYEQVLRSKGDVLGDEEVPSNIAHKRLYRTYIIAVWGYLGFQNHKPVPSSVKQFIRELFPDPKREYMGHIEAERDRNDADDN